MSFTHICFVILSMSAFVGIDAQTTNIANQCKTTAATSSGAAAGSYCAMPFINPSTYALSYEPVDLGYGSICPVTVGQRNRSQSDMSYWAAASCEYVKCVITYSAHNEIPYGTSCVFPFYEQGVLRHGCVTDSQWGGDPWCPSEVDSSYNYEFGEYGTCTCYGDGGLPPPPTPPPQEGKTNPPFPAESPWNPPGPSPPGAPQGSGGDAGAVFAGIGGAIAGIALIVLLGVVYRRARFFRGDFNSDLGPSKFTYSPLKRSTSSRKSRKNKRVAIEHQSLISSSNKNMAYDSILEDKSPKTNSSTKRGLESSGQVGSDMIEDVTPILAPNSPSRPSPKLDQRNQNLQGASRLNEKTPKDSTPTLSSEIGPSTEEIDWAAMEAAAAKLRTCRIVKGDGEKIGMRLLNYLGPNFAGVKIVGVHPGSPAAKAGVLEGDSIVEINNSPIINLYHQEVIELLASSGKSFDIIVCRD